MTDVHDSNPNLPRRPGRTIDEVGVAILDLLVDRGGEYRAEPGEVLKGIALATECDYFAVATAVRMLEDVGFVQVERNVTVRSERGNRVVAVTLL